MRFGNGIIFGLIAGMLWGLDGVLLGSLDNTEGVLFVVLLTACIHDGLAALWIFIVNLHNRKIRQYLKCFRSRQCMTAFFCALLGGALGMTLNVTAISLAGASYTCAVTSAYPVVGAIIGMVFLKEKCNVHALWGIAFVVFGAIIIGFSPVDVEPRHFMMGIVAAIAAMLCWALEGTLSKSAMTEISSDVLIGIRELISCVAYIVILSLIGRGNVVLIQETIRLRGLTVLIVASVAGAFSYLCWYRSMDISGVTVGMSLNATYALWAVIFDVLLNGKILSFPVFVGAMVIFLGTVLTIYSDKREETGAASVIKSLANLNIRKQERT